MIEVTVDTAALSTSRNVGAGRPANRRPPDHARPGWRPEQRPLIGPPK